MGAFEDTSVVNGTFPIRPSKGNNQERGGNELQHSSCIMISKFSQVLITNRDTEVQTIIVTTKHRMTGIIIVVVE